MANRFVLNETSYHGAGAIQEIAAEVKGRGFKKAFVCSDPDLIKFNVTKKVTDVLDSAAIPYEIYSEIKPNPTIENVQTGVAAFKASGADCIIAIGGGSSKFLKIGKLSVEEIAEGIPLLSVEEIIELQESVLQIP